MADDNKKKRSFFSGWLPKLVLLIGIILAVSVALFGVELSLPGIAWALIRIIIGVGLVILMIKGIMSFIEIGNAPPKKRMIDTVKRLAKIQKPWYLQKVEIRGEDMRMGFTWGKVKGLIFIPNIVGKPVVDDKGHYVYEEKRDRTGKVVTDKEGNPIMIHKFADLHEKDGDWLIVAARGFWIFASEDIIRCHYDLVSEIGNKIVIKTTNLLNVDGFLFPTQMWQSDLARINVQHQAEVLQETNSSFWDQLENLASRGVAANPDVKRQQILATESMGDMNPK